jgi:hypothetical protein
MSKANVWTEEPTVPGELMSLVADGLSAHGFRVEYPDHPESMLLTIANGSAVLKCELFVEDTGDIQWEYPAPGNGSPDPRRIADIATALLTGEAGSHEWTGRGDSATNITLKGIVGLELKARGFNVELDIFRDDDHFAVSAEIVVTAARAGGQSQVSVNDSGAITWINDYWPDYAVEAQQEPQFTAWLGRKETIARDIVDTVRRAVNTATEQGGEQ